MLRDELGASLSVGLAEEAPFGGLPGFGVLHFNTFFGFWVPIIATYT